MQALASCLEGQDFRRLGMPWPVRPLASALNAFPTAARTRLYAISGAREGIAARRTGKVSADELYGWAAGRYPRRQPEAIPPRKRDGL